MQEQKFNKRILRKYRKILFPIISKGIITGYNVYQERPQKKSPFSINYLHSDLGFDKEKPQAHLEELLGVLLKFGPVHTRSNLVNSVVDRIAIYKIGDWEDNPKGLRFYDKDGKRLSKKELQTYRGLVVAEGKQHDLGIEVISRKDLNKLIQIFQKYTFANILDKKGRPVKENNKICFNKKAIAGAWEIPLIIISADFMKRQDYLNIADLKISDNNHEISTIVDNSLNKLESEINSHKIPYSISRKFCNRAFVELYINSSR